MGLIFSWGRQTINKYIYLYVIYARRSNQSILKEISPEYSLEKTLMLGGIGGRRSG